ncbi:unnamed protein product [Cunninghamella blakesleeana]
MAFNLAALVVRLWVYLVNSDPPRKRGPPKGHIEVIENRAHRMESLLGKDKQPYIKRNTNNNSNKTTNNNNSNNNININSTTNNNNSSNSNSSNNNSSNNGDSPINNQQSSPSPPVSPRQSSYHLTSANTLLNLVVGAVEALKEKWRADCILTGGPMTNLANDTLPKQFKLQLAEKYFANFNLFLPILSRHHFLHRLAHYPDDIDPLLCYAVCAMGSRYLEHRDDMERLYFERCLLLFEKLKTSEPTISSVQAVIIMCWYTFMMGDLKKCACLRRHLVDFVKRLNLGKNADPSSSIVNTEQRRRTFWIIYFTDGMLSFYTDAKLIHMEKEGWNCKKPILEDSQLKAIDGRNLKWEVEQPLVLKDETAESVLQMPSFMELIQLAEIVGNMYDALKSSSSSSSDNGSNTIIKDLEHELVDWFLHLPSYLDYGKPDVDNSPSPIAKTVRILYHTAQIVLHQSPLLDKDQYTRDNVCNSAADSIIHIAGQMLQQKDENRLYNTFVMSITLAASIHLETAMTRQDQDNRNKERLSRSIRVLKDSNCSYLTKVEFDRLVDRFLTNRCGLTLDDSFKSSYQLLGMWHILQRSRQYQMQQPNYHLNNNNSDTNNNGNNLNSLPANFPKSFGHLEPIILSGSMLPHTTNTNSIDLEGLLNDSMTELIFGSSSGNGNTPSSNGFHHLGWPTHTNNANNNNNNNHNDDNDNNNNNTMIADVIPNSSATISSSSPSSIHNTLHPHIGLQHIGGSSTTTENMQDIESTCSSASPPSYYSPDQTPEEDNRIRLLPATVLPTATTQHITPNINHNDNMTLPSSYII